MKHLDKLNDYINKNNLSYTSNYAIYDEKNIKNTLENIFEELAKNNGYKYTSCPSYSALVKDNEDLDYDFEFIKNKLEEKNYNLNDLKNYLDKNIKLKITLSEWCGYADLLLYKLYNEPNYLYGMSVYDIIQFDEEDETLKLKYEYGWHTNKYGQLVLERDFGSVENFLKEYKEKVLHENEKVNNDLITKSISNIQIKFHNEYYDSFNDIQKNTLDIDEILNIVQNYNNNNNIKEINIYIEGSKSIVIEIEDISNHVVTLEYYKDQYNNNNNYFNICNQRASEKTKTILKTKYNNYSSQTTKLLKFLLDNYDHFTYINCDE
jgi:hypothetical protein